MSHSACPLPRVISIQTFSCKPAWAFEEDSWSSCKIKPRILSIFYISSWGISDREQYVEICLRVWKTSNIGQRDPLLASERCRTARNWWSSLHLRNPCKHGAILQPAVQPAGEIIWRDLMAFSEAPLSDLRTAALRIPEGIWDNNNNRGIYTRRAGKLYKARSWLYRNEFLQVYTRWN